MVIGLVGLIGSGKGTVADILVRKHGFTKMAFADSLKDATAQVFGWDRNLLEGDTPESREFRECPDPFWSKKFGYDFTPREALQRLGTESIRNVFDENTWVYAVQRRIENLINKNVVLADTRFPNEIESIRNMHGAVIHIKRGPDPEWYDTLINFYNAGPVRDPDDVHIFMQEVFPKVHVSEYAWVGTPTNYILYNDSSLDELEVNVDYMLTKFKGPCKIPA